MTELAFTERTAAYPTTNTAKFTTAAAAVIPTFDATVVGTGDPVMVEFHCPAMANSASLLMTTWFVVTAGISHFTTTVQGYRNWSASTSGAGGSMRLRTVLDNGVTYKFEVGISATGASTTTAKGAETAGSVTTGAMFLRVTG